jgi:hypothetical protein
MQLLGASKTPYSYVRVHCRSGKYSLPYTVPVRSVGSSNGATCLDHRLHNYHTTYNGLVAVRNLHTTYNGLIAFHT